MLFSIYSRMKHLIHVFLPHVARRHLPRKTPTQLDCTSVLIGWCQACPALQWQAFKLPSVICWFHSLGCSHLFVEQ